MFELLLHEQAWPFAVALALMLILGVLELVSMIFGGVLSATLESWLPDTDITDFSAPHDNVLNQFFGWLRIRELPVLMSLVVALMLFGLLGLLVQQGCRSVTGALLPAWLAVLATMPLLAPLLRVTLGLLGRVMPKDETSAVSEESLVGRTAVIVLGTARSGSPAQAKVQDEHGYSHYVMVEPDEADLSFAQGDKVLLVRHLSAIYRGIRPLN